MSTALVLRAFTELVYVDLVGLFGFRMIRRIVGSRPKSATTRDDKTVDAVISAVDMARVFYIKPVMCLQHSAVLTRLLRRRGIPAEIVIGCHLAPLQAHAWVEVEGKVVDLQIEAMEHYCILDRW